MRPIAWWLAFATTVLLLAGCTASRPCRTDFAPRPALEDGRLPPPVAAAAPDCAASAACVVFVEYDDYGNPMNRAQLAQALRAAEETARDGGLVVLYAHGWHHDAAPGDKDVQRFAEFIEGSTAVVRRAKRAQARVLGIYLGWRGDSIAARGLGFLPSYVLTFWDRKRAAEAIGASGGVHELLSQLSETRRRHPASRLIVHGHSFGAALLYSAVSGPLIDQVRMDALDARCRIVDGVRPAACPAGLATDLLLLVNPAFEAMRLRPHLDLARRQNYPDHLPPRLVILTTEADWATGVTFPGGRAIGTAFQAYTDPQGMTENVTAVGHHLPYVTHQLTLDDGSVACRRVEMALSSLASTTDQDPLPLCIRDLEIYPLAKPVRLTRCDAPRRCDTVAGEHYLAYGPLAEGFVPDRLPLMNIRTIAAVSGGHTDIRNPTLGNFMIGLLTLAVDAPAAIPLQLSREPF